VTTHGPCPTEQQIAAFVDGALAGIEQAAVMRHVERCEACLDLVAKLGSQVSKPLPTLDEGLREAALRAAARPRNVRRLLPAISAAAAVLVAVVWWRTPAQTPQSAQPAATAATARVTPDDTRSSGSVGLVVVEEPREGDIIDGRPLVRWQGPQDATSYEVQLTTAAGDVVLKHQVQASQRELRLEVPGHQGEVCYLWVAAYLPEGRRIASNVVKVTIRR
jgi:anti-sigma factor RsiW